MKGLYARIAFAFIGIASGVLLISTIAFIVETHYHFSLYQHQAKDMNLSSPTFDTHFEQALVQSVLWSAILGILLSVLLSLFVAKRITAPLIHMKKVAERMAKGELNARSTVIGNDELADLGGSLNHLAEQLLKQEQLRKTMTADVAHELRTPLATLKSHMEAMIDGVWTPTPERLESCYEEIERLRFLVGDLEQLSEVESPNFKLQKRHQDVSLAIKQCVEASKAAFVQKGVHLEFVEGPSVFVEIDRQRFGQIMTNLLSNALKFTAKGGHIKIWMKEEQNKVVIGVADTGSGIKASELPYVFERFYRGEKSRSRKTGGAGIGLSIVKAIVDAHEGEIQIKSKEGQGTEVVVNFNIYKE
ncbi:sensor histidine kinase [Paenibacillus aceris]|uniref:histidine kinase n=1 Tax=Paenibacillus aceris TaxID=869555 RepID=A0ABS4I0E4_9BACL|nr:ATP-binding protein [Paenibacillus aceris]MBP1964290.1 signal transduction histidine kinase [Paenibacillus aceris]NHW36611.1 HAMP domain-containing histidine kinase [Paenibacillus aceris]